MAEDDLQAARTVTRREILYRFLGCDQVEIACTHGCRKLSTYTYQEYASNLRAQYCEYCAATYFFFLTLALVLAVPLMFAFRQLELDHAAAYFSALGVLVGLSMVVALVLAFKTDTVREYCCSLLYFLPFIGVYLVSVAIGVVLEEFHLIYLVNLPENKYTALFTAWAFFGFVFLFLGFLVVLIVGGLIQACRQCRLRCKQKWEESRQQVSRERTVYERV
jgi:hypothetical protein